MLNKSGRCAGSLGCVSPPSVQHTCSQLIKEGLKLTIQSKRRHGAPPQDPKIPRRDEVSADFDDDSGPLSPGDGVSASNCSFLTALLKLNTCN